MAMTIGFVGLGRMGSLMSAHLVAAGYPLVGYDAAGTEERLPPGATKAGSVGEVAATSDVMLLSLPDGSASTSVCREVAAAANLRAAKVVELSTIGLNAARECANVLAEVGVDYIDAPVSGGVAGARAATLAMMVGAPAERLAPLQPLLATFAPKCFRVGDAPGQGQAMKLLNNYVSAAALVATSEAILFGQKFGLDPAQMIDVINASTGRTNASTDKFPKAILPGTYDYGFAGALMTKDVRLFLESADATNSPHPVAPAVVELWKQFNQECPVADFTYIHEWLARILVRA
jgi:3-hydroxyisobutyrate dehydrogenase-like beta-hydroxyacid dehydrogenase